MKETFTDEYGTYYLMFAVANRDITNNENWYRIIHSMGNQDRTSLLNYCKRHSSTYSTQIKDALLAYFDCVGKRPVWRVIKKARDINDPYRNFIYGVYFMMDDSDQHALVKLAR